MANWPDVTIGIITYNRRAEIRHTVEALSQQLTYSGRLRWLVADDSSPGRYIAGLKRLKLFKGLDATFITTEQRSGWGRNANHLLETCETPYLFFIEDDYVLQRPLNLDLGVALMESVKEVGMLRYRATAGAPMVLHQGEAYIGQLMPDYRDGEGAYTQGMVTFCVLDGGSPTLWLYSNGPHLKRVPMFHEFFGRYPEGQVLAKTEERYAHIVQDKMRENPAQSPWIAILPEWINMRWDHIGTSYKGTAEDIGE